MAEGFMVNRRSRVKLPPIGTLSGFAWEEISMISKMGRASKYWNIGDEKDIELSTSEVLTMQIYGFKHDDLTGGGKAGITFGMKDLMADARRMEATNTNANSWGGCEMYSWLNGTLFYQLPQELQDVIKPVDKLTSAGGESATVNTTSDKVFLFSEIECFGMITHSLAGEGSKYPIFTDNASRIKKLSNGTGAAHRWWERSPRGNNSTYFCLIYTDGTAGSSTAADIPCVCFGFCV